MSPTAADKSAAELDKLRAEVEKLRADAAKVAADTAKAQAEADKAQAELSEWQSNSASRTREALAAAETKELDAQAKRLANLDTQKMWITDAVPDLSTVTRGETTGADTALFTQLLGAQALEAATRKTADRLFPNTTPDAGIFFTGDESLLDRLAMHRSVRAQLRELSALIDRASTPVPDAPTDGSSTEIELEIATAVVAGIGAAAAKLLPGALGLLAANRTLSASAMDQDAFATVAAVAGAVTRGSRPPKVYLDETRVLRETTTVEVAHEGVQIKVLALRQSVAATAGRDDEAAVSWRATAVAALEVVDAALQALSATSPEAPLSPLMVAAAQELLADEKVGYAVVVKPAGAASTQLVNDRPLWSKDTVHIRASASISYVTIDLKTSAVVRAGVETAHVELTGRVGARFEVEVS